MPTEINCTGVAEHFQAPERGTLRILVRKDGKDQAAISKEVTKKVLELTELFKSLSPKNLKGEVSESAAVTFWSATTLSTRTVWQADYTVNKYEASLTLSAKFRDFEVLSDTVATLGKDKLLTLYPVSWALTDAARASMISSLRKAAVVDATAKAKDLADALGKQELECTCITLNNTNNAALPAPGGAFSRGGPGGPGGGVSQHQSIEAKPEDIKMSVSLTASFVAS